VPNAVDRCLNRAQTIPFERILRKLSTYPENRGNRQEVIQASSFHRIRRTNLIDIEETIPRLADFVSSQFQHHGVIDASLGLLAFLHHRLNNKVNRFKNAPR
jgi:hypothetical protein